VGSFREKYRRTGRVRDEVGQTDTTRSDPGRSKRRLLRGATGLTAALSGCSTSQRASVDDADVTVDDG
jgi:hypothetical protein